MEWNRAEPKVRAECRTQATGTPGALWMNEKNRFRRTFAWSLDDIPRRKTCALFAARREVYRAFSLRGSEELRAHNQIPILPSRWASSSCVYSNSGS